MDILNLLKNLLSGADAEKIAPVINLLRENSFDIKKVLQNLTPETLMPIIRSFLSSAINANAANGAVSFDAIHYTKADVGRPEKILLSDWPMWIILAGYGVSAVLAVLLRYVVTASEV